MSRGIRNNNPGNIKDFGIPWEGIMADDDRNAAQKSEKTFVVYRRPWWGIRAMAIIFRNYSRKHGLKTVSGMIKRWAPGSDNNPTDVYVQFVATHLSVRINEQIDVEDFAIMRLLVQAVTQFENGKDPYTWQYETGLILAGIEPAQAA